MRTRVPIQKPAESATAGLSQFGKGFETSQLLRKFFETLSGSFRSSPSESISKARSFVSDGLQKTIGMPFATHCEMYLDQGPGRRPLRAHVSQHFRTNFGNVSKPSTRSVDQ
ncbi:uncharacterized protein PGTG_13256 [Puccinia graminis f. sp. tritici CRL 75-36-700-3]|uniref:Uncharacterized protein n=1 Tax=Puccinia graminis f. sp. tritici (strain CRL 75-36-700-3 / race SCCL) TaxID=418459 RepID=E3KRW2_PUCGT|nr:uncharacterized protein PGTG_13256 [Puccinia graminis f. sp. tritici CRL 75-36-700-3]EFP87037.1 hypothetical protein PGTG_13256 [Puccinia graminis f. sp. tritici CRL 75-36-700-3]